MDEHINFSGYIRVLWLNKWIILFFLLVGAGVGWWSISHQKYYRIASAVEVNKINGGVVKKINQIVADQENGIYGSFPGLVVTNPPGTDSLDMYVDSQDVDLAKKEVATFIDAVLADLKKIIENNQQIAGDRIQNETKKLGLNNEEASLINAKIGIIDQEVVRLQSSIFSLVGFREYLESQTHGNTDPLLLFALAQTQNTLEESYGKMNSLSLEKKNLYFRLVAITLENANLNNDISLYEDVKNQSPMAITKAPESIGEIKKKTYWSNILMAGLMGAFLGALIVFFLDMRNKKKYFSLT
jgi:cell division septum initiation protein DivIVA